MPLIEVEAGIDFLRCTYPKTLDGRNAVSALWTSLAKIGKDKGEVATPKYRLGYAGHGGAHWFVGFRDSDTIVEISGALADTMYNLHPTLFANVARIDTQVTYFDDRPTSETLAEIQAQCVEASNERPKAQRFLVDYHGSIEGLETLYIGSRKSEQFARVYDKHAKSPKDYEPGVFRLEVQFENRFAKEIVALFTSVIQPSSLTARDITLQWCAKRGLILDGDIIYNALPLPTYKAANTEIYGKMHWLETQVRPTVRLLRDYVSRVTLESLLGLDDDEPLV